MAFLEMLLSGITTVGEFHYIHHAPGGTPYSDRNELAWQVLRAAQDSGLRVALLRTAYVRSGWGKPTEPGQARFLTPRVEDFIADTEALRAAIARTEYAGKAWVGVAPHSLRAVPLEYLREVAAYAGAQQMPVHMHVSEQIADVEACLGEYKIRLVELLDQNGLLDPRFTAVHAIHVTGEEISRLSHAGATVCACPTTERNLGDGTAPADQFLNAGLRVSLGSDSNVQINLLEDARSLEYHLRILKLERALLAPKQLFECATESGAASVGARSGSLEIGRPADFFTLALDDPSVAGSDPNSLLSNIVFSADRNAVQDVAVGGKFVISEGRHKLQEDIISDFTRLQRELWT
jgi:formimidoylglutamate deiminase